MTIRAQVPLSRGIWRPLTQLGEVFGALGERPGEHHIRCFQRIFGAQDGVLGAVVRRLAIVAQPARIDRLQELVRPVDRVADLALGLRAAGGGLRPKGGLKRRSRCDRLGFRRVRSGVGLGLGFVRVPRGPRARRGRRRGRRRRGGPPRGGSVAVRPGPDRSPVAAPAAPRAPPDSSGTLACAEAQAPTGRSSATIRSARYIWNGIGSDAGTRHRSPP